MNIIINFLSLLIIWSILYYYINNYENFQENEQSNQCKFQPWGLTKDACISRCIVSGKTIDKEIIGDSCNQTNCREICNNCSTSSCEWSNYSEVITNTENTNNLICIPGNNEIKVKLYHEITSSDLDQFFVIQYYKTRYPHEGIHILKIPAKEYANFYETDITNNIENNVEYSVLFYYSNNSNDIDPININTFKSVSKIVTVTPSARNIIQ